MDAEGLSQRVPAVFFYFYPSTPKDQVTCYAGFGAFGPAHSSGMQTESISIWLQLSSATSAQEIRSGPKGAVLKVQSVYGVSGGSSKSVVSERRTAGGGCFGKGATITKDSFK